MVSLSSATVFCISEIQYIHTHTYTRTHAYTHAHTHTFTHTHTHTRTHAYTYTHTNTHTYTPTHIHTLSRSLSRSVSLSLFYTLPHTKKNSPGFSGAKITMNCHSTLALKNNKIAVSPVLSIEKLNCVEKRIFKSTGEKKTNRKQSNCCKPRPVN